MVVAVTTMQKEKVPSSEITKKKVIELIRKDIESNGRTLQQAAVKVCANLIDQGLKDDLFDLFVCDGMEDSYRKSLSTWRRGHAEPELVEAKPEQVMEVEPDTAALATGYMAPIAAEPAPNIPYDPTMARGIGDRIIQELPALTGRLAAPYWVSEGRQKPLGMLNKAERKIAIERYRSSRDSYVQTVTFLERVDTGTRDDQLVHEAFPDPQLLEIIWNASAP